MLEHVQFPIQYPTRILGQTVGKEQIKSARAPEAAVPT